MGIPIISGVHRGLYTYNNQLWAHLGDHVYRVQLDSQSGQPRIIAEDSSGALGPWLHRNNQGAWQLDLGLRLRGGMPRNSRIAQRKAETEKRQQALRSTYEAQLALVPMRLQESEKLFCVIEKFKELTILKGATEKLYTLETFWDERVNTISLQRGGAIGRLQIYPVFRTIRKTLYPVSAEGRAASRSKCNT
ncbi:DUF6543 domain-containing protein [Pseudomonas arcuscaelestis]|uniref:DUF6543 domain-containing protein n=1 Tax=Pseudomonas arcuscaelestis TaxID=2710591 RepID=UPI00193D29D6|nr:DUF6543 domain-containing protein [Pseudomonas arcuscaelestis]MBM3114094.1 hypothetical protein [Pseudomonas arcuscaelestis]